MTREQQLEVQKIIERKGGAIDGNGRITQSTCLFTTDIDALRRLNADLWYEANRQQMKISYWNLSLLKEPKESATRMEVRAFEEDSKIELVKKDFGEGHDDIHIFCNGEDLGFMHIWSKKIYWWPIYSHRQVLDLQ